MSEKISFDELKKMMEDPNIDDSKLAPYLVIDGSSDPFAPRMIPNPETVDTEEPIARGIGIIDRVIDGGMAGLNALARAARHRHYDGVVASGKYRVKVVSEGDSWFQFPVALTDVIDHLSGGSFRDCEGTYNYAVYSLGAGGDLLSGEKGIIKQNEIPAALEKTGAEILLISIGGNDLLGNIGPLLKRGNSEKPEDYLDENEFEYKMKDVFKAYSKFLASILEQFEQVNILCHGYDYAIPSNRNVFLGLTLHKPMMEKGITAPVLQKAIMRHVVDVVNDQLVELVIKPLNAKYKQRVHYVDCRGAIGDHRWHDEIHPNDEGFLFVAKRFHKKIVEITGIPDKEKGCIHPSDIDPNYYYRIIEFTKGEDVRLHEGVLKRWERLDTDEQLFLFRPLGDGWYQISCKANPDQVWTLTHEAIFGFGDFHVVKMGASTTPPSVYNKFKIVPDGDDVLTFKIEEATNHEVIDVYKGVSGLDWGPYVGCLCRWEPVNLARQRFKLKKVGPKE